MIGDPVFTVPYLTPPGQPKRNLCYEVHGRPDTNFNLISDACVSVNALFSGVVVNDDALNIISSIGIKAQDNDGNCRDIRVDLDQCSVSTGMSGAPLILMDEPEFSQSGISIRRRMTDRVRVSVPNCDNVQLIMWVVCERGAPVDMIRFHISRGLNLRPTSHGLLGKEAKQWSVWLEGREQEKYGYIARSYALAFLVGCIEMFTVSPYFRNFVCFLHCYSNKDKDIKLAKHHLVL